MTANEIQQVVNTTLIQLGLLKPYVTQAEAFRMYGRSKVELWIKEGWIKYLKDTETGSKRFQRTELEVVASKNNVLNKYLKTPKNATLKRTNRKNVKG